MQGIEVHLVCLKVTHSVSGCVHFENELSGSCSFAAHCLCLRVVPRGQQSCDLLFCYHLLILKSFFLLYLVQAWEKESFVCGLEADLQLGMQLVEQFSPPGGLEFHLLINTNSWAWFYACKPKTWEAETGRSQVCGQWRLHSEIYLRKWNK